MKKKLTVGNLEQCDLPELGIKGLHVRVDTGATTSSLHVDNIEEIDVGEDTWIKFDIHPDIHDVKKLIRCEAKVAGQDRSEMTYLMLFGREAMAGRFIVDPELEYLLNKT